MKRAEIFAVLRSLLSVAGAYLVGINVFGVSVDQSLWQIIVGGVMSAAGILFSVFDKTLTSEMFAAFCRQALTVGGGYLVAAGKLKGEVVVSLLALIPVIIPYIQGILTRRKSKALQTGVINPFDLTK